MRNTPAGQTSGPGDINHLYPWRHFLHGYASMLNASSQVGTWQRVTTQWEAALQVMNNGWGMFNTAGAQNDELAYNLPMSAGTWTITLITRKSSNTGICTVLIDGTSVGTADTFAASVGLGIFNITGVTVATSGVHKVTLRAATKNASSTGFFLNFLAADIFRTA